jgi:hypothetical protein
MFAVLTSKADGNKKSVIKAFAEAGTKKQLEN